MDAPTSTALDGVRVLDLTAGPAGGLATMILADFGAEVLLVERPGGDHLSALPAAPLWRRGKRTVTIDLDTTPGLDDLHELCAGADVLVTSWRPAALRAKGLDFDTLHARHEHLIVCHIGGFDTRGPLADLPGYEHLVAARTGRMRVFAGTVDRSGPVFPALQVGTHACAQSAAAGILAALLARGENGPGRLVETSILRGLLAYEQGVMLGTQFRERFGTLYSALQSTSDEPPMPSLYYHPAQANDGVWLQFGNLLPHLFENFLIATNLIDVVTDPDFDAAQMVLPPEKHEAFRDRMLARIQERPAAAWMADFIANGGIVATAYQTTQRALDDPDVTANGHVIPRADGGVQLGPVARLTRTPAKPGPDAAPDGLLAAAWRTTPRARPAGSEATPNAPLTGIRVVELATIIAAPLGAAFLADMGADVVKVEQIGGDPYRAMAAGIGSARVNAGKRSISVDLKSTRGRDIVLALIRDADVVIHNFRPGVPERLGIGYDELSAINPQIVYLQCNGYGPDGPGALRPSTHPIPGAAMGGVLYQMGERVPAELQDRDGLRLWTRRLMRANEVNPDPNTALVVTTSVMLGLVARQRTGEGQRVLVDMFGANAYANHDDFLAYPGKPDRPMPDQDGLGLSATYRLYPCAGGEWVFLAVTNDRERRLFVETLCEAGLDAPDVGTLAEGGTSTRDALTRLFAGRDAAAWESMLAAAGVGCVRADGPVPGEYWLDAPELKSRAFTVQAEHPDWGTYRRHGPMMVFDRAPAPLRGPPLAGGHNETVLAELGFDAEETARLHADGVLWREPDA